MSFSEFLSFCRHAIRMRSKSPKPAAAVNCAALNELVDIAIRLHRHMDRLGTLGPGESRFMSRMFLHLQLATMKRVVYTSSAVFKEATEVFMTRLPKNAFSSSTESAASGSARATKALHDKQNRSQSKSGNGWGKPKSGCYLCAATDHYCSDRSKHAPTESGR